MPYTVSGSVEGLAYALRVYGEVDREPVTGTQDVVLMLEGHVGETFGATPTGPYYVLDLTDEASVLVALRALTYVHEHDDTAPEIVPPQYIDADY